MRAWLIKSAIGFVLCVLAAFEWVFKEQRK
jgi:hypothetical protein